LLGGNSEAASVVANIAAALGGHENLWESWDQERSWLDRNKGKVLAATALALDIVAVVGAVSCAASAGAGCAISAAAGLAATGVGAIGAQDTCSSGSSSCSFALGGTAMDVGSGVNSQLTSQVVGQWSSAAAAKRGGGAATLLFAPAVLAFDAGLVHDAWTTNPFWYPQPSPSAIAG